MQPGWNLGNTLDAIPNETAWSNPPVTQEFFQQIKAQGFNSIRIPVTWDAGTTGVLARYSAVWSQIATLSRSLNKLMFESLNEPEFDGVDDATKMAPLHDLNS